MASWRSKQKTAKQGITPVTNTGAILWLLLVTIFFFADITCAIKELQKRGNPRQFAHTDRIPLADEVYRFLSLIDEERFIALINALLRTQCKNQSAEPLGRLSSTVQLSRST